VQQINLFQPLFRKKQEVLTGKAIVQIGISVVVGLGLASGYLGWRVAGLDAEMGQVQTRYAEAVKRLEDTSRKFPAKKKSQLLEAEVARLAAEKTAKQRVMKAISQDRVGNGGGFSAYLEGLARQRLDGVWLTGLAIADGGMNVGIYGSTVEPDLVPRFLQRLSEESAFSGKEFKTFKMLRPEGDDHRIDFTLGTRGAERSG